MVLSFNTLPILPGIMSATFSMTPPKNCSIPFMPVVLNVDFALAWTSTFLPVTLPSIITSALVLAVCTDTEGVDLVTFIS